MKKFGIVIKVLFFLVLISLTQSCKLLPRQGGVGGPLVNFFVNGVCPSTESNSTSSTSDTGSRSDISKSQLQNNGTDSEFFLSYRVGAGTSVPIGEKLSFNPRVLLSGKGNKTSSAGFEDKLTSTYLDFPLLVDYKLGSSKFSINGGLQPSILLSAKRKIEFEGNEDSQKVTDQFNTFDLAASIGVGYNFDNGFGINLGYDHGLTNINKSDSNFGSDFKAHNRALHLGVSYTLNKRK